MTVTFNDGLTHIADVAKEHEQTIFNDLKENGIMLKQSHNTGSWRPFHTVKQIDWIIK